MVKCFQVKIAEPLRCEISQRNALFHLLNNFLEFLEHLLRDVDFSQYLQRSGDVVKCYGCIISIDIYDTVPDVVKQDTPTVIAVENVTPAAPPVLSEKSRHTYGIIYIVLGVILALLGLLLLLVTPVGGIFAIAGGVFSVTIGKKYRKS